MAVRTALAALAATAAASTALALAGCGQSESLNVVEGEPVTLGTLSYNVSITRFLNPFDTEDRAYLAGQKPLPSGKQWLAVFMDIHNEGDASATVPSDLRVTDTQGNEYRPVPSQSVFALQPGAQIGPHDDLPEPESAAANGPIQGAMVLFQIREASIENRPLVLSIPGPGGETGTVELDI